MSVWLFRVGTPPDSVKCREVAGARAVALASAFNWRCAFRPVSGGLYDMVVRPSNAGQPLPDISVRILVP
jgi:hypothetical protein